MWWRTISEVFKCRGRRRRGSTTSGKKGNEYQGVCRDICTGLYIKDKISETGEGGNSIRIETLLILLLHFIIITHKSRVSIIFILDKSSYIFCYNMITNN
jgi:hypothetical protein